MILQMMVDGKLVASAVLSLDKIKDLKEREAYIQGAVNDLLEQWSDWLGERNASPEFFIKASTL